MHKFILGPLDFDLAHMIGSQWAIWSTTRKGKKQAQDLLSGYHN